MSLPRPTARSVLDAKVEIEDHAHGTDERFQVPRAPLRTSIHSLNGVAVFDHVTMLEHVEGGIVKDPRHGGRLQVEEVTLKVRQTKRAESSRVMV